MEARVTVLETKVDAMERDVRELVQEVRELNQSLAKYRGAWCAVTMIAAAVATTVGLWLKFKS